MGEVAVQLFGDNPTTFLEELRRGRYYKTTSNSPELLKAIAELKLPTESQVGLGGIALLTPETVEILLQDKRRFDLKQPFKLAILKVCSQEAARLMAAGEYDAALPVALQAIQHGEKLFKPQPALQMYPLYLLAAQVNLGLKKTKQCEDFLGLASWLSMRDPKQTSNTMKSQLSRLYGQLQSLQGKHDKALDSFSEDVYYCSMDFGPWDVRTSLGYYNLAKVFQKLDQLKSCLACCEQVLIIWRSALELILYSQGSDVSKKQCKMDGVKILFGNLQVLEVVDMLLDIASIRGEALGPQHPISSDAQLVAAMALIYLGEKQRASEELQSVKSVYTIASDKDRLADVQKAIDFINDSYPKLVE